MHFAATMMPECIRNGNKAAAYGADARADAGVDMSWRFGGFERSKPSRSVPTGYAVTLGHQG